MGGGEVRNMKWETQRRPFSYSSFFPLPPATSSLSFYSILTVGAPYEKLESPCVDPHCVLLYFLLSISWWFCKDERGSVLDGVTSPLPPPTPREPRNT